MRFLKLLVIIIFIDFFTDDLCSMDIVCRSDSTDSITVINTIEQILRNKCHTNFKATQIITDGSLYVRAFNVGQANFIVLRKENKAVIVDAGTQSTEYFDSIPELRLQEMFDDVSIEAIFFTHPHEDHYNLFTLKSTNLKNTYNFNGTNFFLGGRKSDWQDKEQLISNIEGVGGQIHYLTECASFL